MKRIRLIDVDLIRILERIRQYLPHPRYPRSITIVFFPLTFNPT